MAAYGWHADRPLTERMRQNPNRFNFYQLVRLLLIERGGTTATLDNHLRFHANLDMAFPAHEVRALAQTDHDALINIETGNYTLAGYMGPVPEPIVEQMIERLRDGDRAMPAFFDLFNHRINALRYQIKNASRLALNLLPPEATPVAKMLAALMGMSAPGLAEQLPLSERCWLGLAGLLANPRHSPAAVIRTLSHYLGASVAIESMVGAWRTLPSEDMTRLGLANQSLGQSTRLGTHAWMPAARITLRVAPLHYTQFCRLLPDRTLGETTPPATRANPPHPALGQSAYPGLTALLRFLLHRRQDAWVELHLKPETKPASRLTAKPYQRGENGNGYWGLRLGQTAWLSGQSDTPLCARFLVYAHPVCEQST